MASLELVCTYRIEQEIGKEPIEEYVLWPAKDVGSGTPGNLEEISAAIVSNLFFKLDKLVYDSVTVYFSNIPWKDLRLETLPRFIATRESVVTFSPLGENSLLKKLRELTVQLLEEQSGR